MWRIRQPAHKAGLATASRRLAFDGQQLDFKRERGLAADLDSLHAFGLAGHGATQRKARGHAALVGAVELRAVGQRAPVVNAHGAGGGGGLTLQVAHSYKLLVTQL